MNEPDQSPESPALRTDRNVNPFLVLALIAGLWLACVGFLSIHWELEASNYRRSPICRIGQPSVPVARRWVPAKVQTFTSPKGGNDRLVIDLPLRQGLEIATAGRSPGAMAGMGIEAEIWGPNDDVTQLLLAGVEVKTEHHPVVQAHAYEQGLIPSLGIVILALLVNAGAFGRRTGIAAQPPGDARPG